MRTRLRTLVTLAATLSLIGLSPIAPPSASAVTDPDGTVFISEIHYDNDGTDAGEAVEIFGPAGTSLDGWSLVLYNGSGGAVYNTVALAGTLAEIAEGAGVTVVPFPANGLQNGSPDGLALVDDSSTVQQFLSYEGAFTAADGPAAGMTSTDIGVAEDSSTAIGESLQLAGTGSCYGALTWTGPELNTFGALGLIDPDAAAECGGGDPGDDPPPVRFNELHYDNAGTDENETIEIVGPAGTDLSGWTVVLYNGNGGAPYSTTTLTGSIPDLGGGQGVVVVGYPTNGIQNGPPDGFALAEDAGALVEFLSYEGSFTGVGGPADGVTSTDIGVAEGSSTAADQSLQRSAAGTWAGPFCNSFGALNDPDPAVTCPIDASPADLLLTEVVVTPTGGEFVEIHNTGAGPVDLGDVYLTDATFAPGGTFYYNIVTGSNAGGGGFGDFHARFPDGASIGAGEYQTIAMAGSAAFVAEYGTAPTYELFDDGSADGEQLMREATPGSINGQGGLTNGGEIVVLYTWDGASDLVADIDYLVWGDRDEAVDKTGVAVDGPDADTDASSYLADTAISSQDVVAGGSHAFGFSWQRDDLTEGAELQTGGNGVDGSDETSEDVSNTWCEAAPTPGAASSCPTGPTYTARPIHDVQGDGAVSPHVGEGVIVDGIVVGDFQASGELNGFYLQEPDADADGNPATSEGIFVFEGGSTVDVNVGDLVEVTGLVAEFSELTEVTDVVNVTVVSSGNPLPAATAVTFPLATDLERYEGMSVHLPQTLVISEFFNYDRYGEVVLTNPFGGLERHFQPTSYVEPGADALAVAAEIAANRITLDDGSGVQNPDVLRMPDGTTLSQSNFFRGGDQVADVVGVMDFARGLYRIQPTVAATYTATNLRQSAPDDVGGSITVASLNVLNYFLTIDDGSNNCGPLQDQNCRGADDVNEFERQRDKLLVALAALDADVIGLVELENTPGVSPEADIVAGLNEVFGPGTYDYIDTGAIGEDPIRASLIYRTGSVLPLGEHAVLTESVDPRFLDEYNRPAVAQSFVDRSTGGVTTVAVNHLKSKGSGCDGDPDAGDGQGNCNGTRTAAAEALADWLAGDPTGSRQGDAMIIGDLNSYDEEDPIAALLDAGYVDLVEAADGEFAYTYVFDGQWGHLDYALASAGLGNQVTDSTVWHINADESDVFDYNTSFRGPGQTGLYSPDPYRVSDHDPVLVGLDLDLDAEAVLGAARDIVAELEAGGYLNKGQANSLTRSLDQALRQIERGQHNGARGILTGVVSQVGDFVDDGILTAEQGTSITDLVDAVLAGL